MDKSKGSSRGDLHSIAFSERSDLGGSRSFAGNAAKPPRTLSAAVIKESIHEMSMSMSVTHEEMLQLRAHNPFNASGSLSSSSNSNLASFNPGAKTASNARSQAQQHKMIDEDDEYQYESDFEDDQEVEPYRDEGKFDSRKGNQRSPDYNYSSPSTTASRSPYYDGPSSSNSNSSRYGHK